MQRKSLLISLGLHGALVLAALVVLPNPEEFKPKPQESIQVDISNIGAESKKKAQTTAETKPADKPKPKETKTVEKVKPKPKVAEEVKTAAVEPAKEEPPPEPKKEAPPEPKKEPIIEDKPVDSDPLKDLLAEEQKIEAENAALAEKKIVEKKKADEKKKKADEKKKAEAEAKKVADAEAKEVADADAKKKLDAEKKKQKLNVDQLEALLNKTEGESAAPLETAEAETGEAEKAKQDVQGNDDAISATIVDALVSKVKECFNIPPAAREADISVQIRFQLNQDGSVRGQPEVANSSGDPVFAATARAAMSAIVECQTYDLPQDRYDLWESNKLDFNPNTFGT